MASHPLHWAVQKLPGALVLRKTCHDDVSDALVLRKTCHDDVSYDYFGSCACDVFCVWDCLTCFPHVRGGGGNDDGAFCCFCAHGFVCFGVSYVKHASYLLVDKGSRRSEERFRGPANWQSGSWLFLYCFRTRTLWD